MNLNAVRKRNKPFVPCRSTRFCPDCSGWLKPKTTRSVYGSLIEPTNSESDFLNGIRWKIINESDGIRQKIFNSLALPVLKCWEQMPRPRLKSWQDYLMKMTIPSPPCDAYPALASRLNLFFVGCSPIKTGASDSGA